MIQSDYPNQSGFRIGRLGLKNLTQIQSLLPNQCSMLASYCLQVAILNNPSLVKIANSPATRTLNFWISRGHLTDVQYRFLAFDQYVLDQVFWGRLNSDFYIGYVRLPMIFGHDLLKKRYERVFKGLQLLAEQDRSTVISTQLINPTFIDMFKDMKFEATSPEGVGLPVTFQRKLKS